MSDLEDFYAEYLSTYFYNGAQPITIDYWRDHWRKYVPGGAIVAVLRIFPDKTVCLLETVCLLNGKYRYVAVSMDDRGPSWQDKRGYDEAAWLDELEAIIRERDSVVPKARLDEHHAVADMMKELGW